MNRENAFRQRIIRYSAKTEADADLGSITERAAYRSPGKLVSAIFRHRDDIIASFFDGLSFDCLTSHGNFRKRFLQ